MSPSPTKKVLEMKTTSLWKSGAVAVLLFLNMFMVIFGYGLAVFSVGVTVGPMQKIKLGILFISFIHVFSLKRNFNFSSVFSASRLPFVFSLLILVSCFWSDDLLSSFNKAQTLIIPMLYIYFSIELLIKKHGLHYTMQLFHKMLMYTFSIPIIAYLLTSPSLTASNIYGYMEDSDQVFVSNHYGWASTILILTILSIYNYIKSNSFYRILSLITILFCFFLILVSASRSSMFSLLLGIMFLLFFFKGTNKFLNVFLIIFFVSGLFYLLVDETSGINLAIQRTDLIQQGGESRLEVTKIISNHFNQNPILWFTGMGFYDHSVLERSNALIKGYHNSYWEVLFGLGLPGFILFLNFAFFRPLKNYFRFFSKWSLLLPPLIIIPFFESNITGGQFLFFPWFIYIFLLNVRKEYWQT